MQTIWINSLPQEVRNLVKTIKKQYYSHEDWSRYTKEDAIETVTVGSVLEVLSYGTEGLGTMYHAGQGNLRDNNRAWMRDTIINSATDQYANISTMSENGDVFGRSSARFSSTQAIKPLFCI